MVLKFSFDREKVMSIIRSFWSVVVVSCLLISPCAEAALETAAHKASTSVGMAKTPANAWALETDPVVSSSADDSSTYYLSGSSLDLTYYTGQLTLIGNSSGLPDLEDSTLGLNHFYVTSYQIDYDAAPGGHPDPGPTAPPDSYADGYPNVLVTLTPTANDSDAATDSFRPDADGNLPDLNLPVGLIENIMCTIPMADLTDNPDSLTDVDLYDFLFNGPGNTPANPGLDGVVAGVDSFVTFTDVEGDTMTFTGPTEINNATVPEPASASLIAISVVGLLRRRSR
jgi:hypothetical protein